MPHKGTRCPQWGYIRGWSIYTLRYRRGLTGAHVGTGLILDDDCINGLTDDNFRRGRNDFCIKCGKFQY